MTRHASMMLTAVVRLTGIRLPGAMAPARTGAGYHVHFEVSSPNSLHREVSSPCCSESIVSPSERNRNVP